MRVCHFKLSLKCRFGIPSTLPSYKSLLKCVMYCTCSFGTQSCKSVLKKGKARELQWFTLHSIDRKRSLLRRYGQFMFLCTKLVIVVISIIDFLFRLFLVWFGCTLVSTTVQLPYLCSWNPFSMATPWCLQTSFSPLSVKPWRRPRPHTTFTQSSNCWWSVEYRYARNKTMYILLHILIITGGDKHH